MHVGYSKFRYPDITGVWNLDYAHIQKILKEPSKIRSLGQENHTNHCLSLMKYFNPVSWKWCDQNIVEYCRLVSLKYVRPTVVITKPSRAIIGNPIESQKETWYEQMWEAEKISELKDEKYFRMFTKNNMTAFESGEYSFAIQDIWAEGVWGNHNIGGQCSVEKGVRMKTEK